MADLISLDKARAAKTKERNKGKTLCKNGHHKWEIDKAKQFDSKLGKLVTAYICKHCKKRKVKAL